ncbi:hypothetical protein B484DRAFT_441841 [Ochromonadaceae sp. CCMP2298]|nr:hypothetical protein B484DRAFT_441841 [Ochromonadaceae sp. CCMP2298]|eukprot:CAMPEP_0173201520 /NCGR_PEP_ID=MMETSP1141-20130122/18396_1 /TAXON_ID=483371 /ORGANISM="non described non described, Strain CCMP2298" /LENGTH=301 /DNA_ID=CAMNT_0014126649 /DNA_START=135 /DNA_END=1040 /DNA_ORIENTATION=+
MMGPAYLVALLCAASALRSDAFLARSIRPSSSSSFSSTRTFFMPEASIGMDVASLTESVANNMGSLLTAEETGYSSLSLYFTLALYVLTLPGLYSLVTRSVKAKATERIYDLPGPANPTSKSSRQIAAEVMAYFKALNYEVTAAEDVIYFKGVMGKSKSQASFLTFCTFVGLGSLALVLSILFPDVGSKAYVITLLSPYAGIYYWNNASREDQVAVKMETSDDEQTTSITAQGGKEDLERFAKTLGLPVRGMEYVPGLLAYNGDIPAMGALAVAGVKTTPTPAVVKVVEEVEEVEEGSEAS